MSQPPRGKLNPYAPPTASLEPEFSPPRAATFRTLRPLAQAITALLLIYVAVQVVCIGQLGGYVSAVQRAFDGGASGSAAVESITRRLAITQSLLALVCLPMAVLFCMFVFRANTNVRAFDLIHPQFTPGWAVGVFFVPIWNFYKPYQVMREIWQGSSPDPDAVVVASSLRGVPLLKWWWGLYLASFLQVQAFNQGAGAAAFVWRAEKSMVGHVVNLASAVLAIAVVRGVAARQDARQRVRPVQLT